MKKLVYGALWLVLAISLSVAISCDSSDNGGGGTTPAVGSSLAGQWQLKWVIAKGTGKWGSMTVDSTGKVTKFMSPSGVCGTFYAKAVSGSLVQNGDTVSARIIYYCPTVPGKWMDIYDLKMISPDRMQGKFVVYVGHTLIVPTWDVIAIRR